MRTIKYICNQEHQIDLCKSCSINIRRVGVIDKDTRIKAYTPMLTPKQSCYGYRTTS